MADFQGIIVIHKEKGFTSHDVVAKLRGILHMKKIGHTGTLDPDATGVLPVALGKGTKLVDLLTDKEKTYEAVLHLGIDTDTQDMSGTVLEERPVNVTEEEVRKVLKSFVGEQLQVPPMYSALKVNGKKLYELAREGKTVERKARPVCFYEIEPLEFHLPLVKIRVTAVREPISAPCAMILARSLAVAAVWKNCSGQGLVGILSLRAIRLPRWKLLWQMEPSRI